MPSLLPLLLAALLAAGGLCADADEEHVLVLSEKNFSSTVNAAGKVTMVEFYAPWCGHCKTLAPEYARAARELSASTPAAALAKVDATVESQLAGEHNVMGYPTLKIFHAGKEYDYDGEREAAAIVAEMKKYADPGFVPPVDAVVDLNETSFAEFIKAPLTLVEFFAPWCGHCKSLAPKYEKAAKKLAGLATPISLGKVDATQHGALAQEYGVEGYPTLKVFRNSVPSDYRGGRDTAEEITEEMLSLSQPAARPIEDAVALHMFSKQATALVALGFFDGASSKILDTFEGAADLLRKEIAFAFTRHAGARQQYGVPPNTVVLLQPAKYQSSVELPRQTLTITDATTPRAVADFVLANKYPLAGHRTRDSASPAANRYDERPLICVYFDVQYTADLQAETNHWREVVAKVARKHRNRVNKDLFFAIADEQEFKAELEDLGLYGSDAELVVAAFDKDSRYVMKEDFDAESFAEFVQSFLDGELKPYIKSQKPPKKALDGGVAVVVGSTFQKIVMDPSKHVLLEIYAPWCGHCKSLTPIYSQLAKKLKGIPDLVIAKLDGTANDVPAAYRAKGFPTILLAKKNGKAEPVKYEGERTVEKFVEFLQRETGLALPRTEL